MTFLLSILLAWVTPQKVYAEITPLPCVTVIKKNVQISTAHTELREVSAWNIRKITKIMYEPGTVETFYGRDITPLQAGAELLAAISYRKIFADFSLDLVELEIWHQQQIVGRAQIFRPDIDSPTFEEFAPIIREKGARTWAFISYVIASKFRGQGLAGEVTEGLKRTLFEEYGVDAVLATVLTKNTPSRKVLEKNGFEIIGSTTEWDLWFSLNKRLRTH